jgi:L-aspartate oxidase
VETCRADLVVVGTGIAGLACALHAAGRVLLLTKTDLPEGGSSYLAKGGIAAALSPGDSPETHAADTLAVACGVADPEVVRLLTAAAPAAVEALEALGVPFARDGDRRLALGREAAHAFPRIAHAGGDATGRHVCDALIAALRRRPNVTLLEGCFAYDLLACPDGSVRGLLAYDDAHGWLALHAPRVVLATGGIGALYAETTNPPEATGDGLAMAARAGAVLADLEFVQFHPTALAVRERGRPLPLLSEALRGAGASLVDERGRRFMDAADLRAELAPRDVVARAVHRRRVAGRATLLDLRPALAASPAGFPSAVAACRRAGHDPFSRPVPVIPAAHYHMGGVAADARGRTSLAGLWVCGEAAGTGAHGANRLASNSLLEAYVMGARVAADAAAHAPAALGAPAASPPPDLPDPAAVLALRERLQATASRHLGVERDREGLECALAETAAVQRDLARLPASRLGCGAGWLAAVRAHGELRNLRLTARLVAATALGREESRGAHHRRDFPDTSPAWARRRLVTLAELCAAAPVPQPSKVAA